MGCSEIHYDTKSPESRLKQARGMKASAERSRIDLQEEVKRWSDKIEEDIRDADVIIAELEELVRNGRAEG